MLVSILLILCILCALAPYTVRKANLVFFLTLLGSSAIFGFGLVVGLPRLVNDPMLSGYQFWYVDTFSGVLLALIGFVQWTAVMASITYLWQAEADGVFTFSHIRRYFVLFFLLIATMYVTIVANNLALMLIGLAGSVYIATKLIRFDAKEESIAAARTYSILNGAGLAIAALGLCIILYVAHKAGLGGITAINWVNILYHPQGISAGLMQAAFWCMLVGLGTFTGLTPFQLWLPEAHSRAPSPIGGVLSSVLLGTGFFALMRFKLLTTAVLQTSNWTDSIFIVFGLLSMIVAGLFILWQKEYKRALAYSSIQHMGIMTFSAAFGVWGVVATIIHLVGHSLIKSALFFSSEEVAFHFKSTVFSHTRGVIRALPMMGTLITLGLLGLLAVPPSFLFSSEQVLVQSALVKHPVYLGVFIATIIGTIGVTLIPFSPFLFAKAPKIESKTPQEPEVWTFTHTGIALHLILVITGGVLWWNTFLHEPIFRIIGFIR